MTDTDTLARHEAKTEPPVVWRNWWQAVHTGVSHCRCGKKTKRAKGDQYPAHCGGFATKEEAEAYAAKAMIKDSITVGFDPANYLGAYPEPAP